jgi:hypothetical protein
MIRGNNRILLLLALVVTVYLVHLGLKRDTGSVVPKPGRGSRPLGRTGSRQGAQAALGSKPGDHAPEVYVDAEAENAAARRAQTHPLKTSNLDVEFNGVELDERGHVVFDAHKHSAVHPIRLLMERAKKQVEQIDTRIKAVTSLQDAVDDYVRAWKMRPPKGFDKW